MNAVVKELRKIREEKKITQKEAAKHLGIINVTLSRYECGKKEMGSDLLLKYAEYLGHKIKMERNITNEKT